MKLEKIKHDIIVNSLKYLKDNFQYGSIINVETNKQTFLGNLNNFNESDNILISNIVKVRIIHDKKQYKFSTQINNLLLELKNINNYLDHTPIIDYQYLNFKNTGEFYTENIDDLSYYNYKQICFDICNLINEYKVNNPNIIKTIEDICVSKIEKTHVFYDTNDLIYTKVYNSSYIYGVLVVNDVNDKLCSSYYAESINFGFNTQLFVNKLIKKACEKTNAKLLTSDKYDILILNSTGGLWGYLYELLNGKLQSSNESCIKINDQIFSENINIWEDPTYKLNEYKFDDEGVLLNPKYLVKNGIVMNYFCDTFFANLLKMSPGNYFNFNINETNIFSNNQIDIIDAIYKSQIIVTEFIGDSFNNVTGDLSINIFGFYYDEKKQKIPINNIILSGNIKDFFKNTLIVNDANDQNILGSLFISNCYISSSI